MNDQNNHRYVKGCVNVPSPIGRGTNTTHLAC